VIDVNDSHCDVPDRGTVEGDKITFTTDETENFAEYLAFLKILLTFAGHNQSK
jgi:hypothetical protein